MDNSRSNHPPIQNNHHPVPAVGVENLLYQNQAATSSPYHVHPTPAAVPVQQGFQSQEANMFHPKGLKPHQENREGPILGRALCLTSKDSPVPGRVSHLNEKFQDSITMYSDTDEIFGRIKGMFPTVDHTHIRILLKKYYNREAVVISALQVEKHPIATPGPLTMSPSAARLNDDAPDNSAAAQLSPTPAAPATSVAAGGKAPRPILSQGTSSAQYRGARPRHSSQRLSTKQTTPKMKIKSVPKPIEIPKPPPVLVPKTVPTVMSMRFRYLTAEFPTASEECVLNALTQCDNNVFLATNTLSRMGHLQKPRDAVKKETMSPALNKIFKRTLEDRQRLFEKLQDKYWSVPERLIQIALESVEFNEQNAGYLLAILLHERAVTQREERKAVVTKPHFKIVEPKPQLEAEKIPSALNDLPEQAVSEEMKREFRSSYKNNRAGMEWKMANGATGPNPAMRQGPQDKLLLEDYMPWNGPNPDLRLNRGRPNQGLVTLARGPSGMAKGPSGIAKGASGNAKGALAKAKGSMFCKRK